jgi:hypothetical protein
MATTTPRSSLEARRRIVSGDGDVRPLYRLALPYDRLRKHADK